MTICMSCGTKLVPGERHFKGKWHAVAREARIMRRVGLSYSDIARELQKRGFKISKAFVWKMLKEEGM